MPAQSLWLPASKLAASARALLPGLMAAMFLLSGHDVLATTYLSDGATGDPTVVTSWTNSAGANPADFLHGDTFIILNGATYSIASGETWTVNATSGGTAAAVQVNSGGTLSLATASGSATLLLGGNFIQSGTFATTSASSAGLIDFTANGTWTGSGDLSSGGAAAKISVTVDAGVTLDASGMSSGFKLGSSNTKGITVNGTLNLGTNSASGNAGGNSFFTLATSGTLITARTTGVPSIFTNFNTGKVTLPTTANYTFDGTAAQVTGNSTTNATMPTEVNNLTNNNSAGLTLSQPMQVDGTLALTAGVVTGNVTVSSGGAIAGGGSTAYVNGQLTVTFTAPSAASFTFPVGTAGAYSPVSIANFTDTETGTLTASATAGQNPNQSSSSLDDTLYIARYWTLTGSGFSSPVYDFTGTFVAGDIQPGVNTANLLVQMFDGSNWELPASTSSTSTTVTGTGFTSFGQFASGDPLILPVLNSTTVSAIANTSATLGATVITNGGSSITSYGIVWGTAVNPTTASNKVQFGTSVTPPSTFTVNATGLPAATTIYYRGYATSANGTGYSTNGTFLTLANPPTVQATGAAGSSLQNGNLTFTWTRGNGTNCIVLVSDGSAVSAAPVAGTAYTASATFGNGSQIGSGNYVAFLGTGTSVTISGLSSSTTYYVAVFELNGSGGSQNYLTSSPATASQTTVAVPIPTITWTGSQDVNWNNVNNWNPLALPGVGTSVNVPIGVVNQPLYSNQMAAASFGSITNAGILTIATNGFNSGSLLLNYPGNRAQLLVTNNGIMSVAGNVALTSNSVVVVSAGGSLTASGQLLIGSNPTGGSSGATVSSYGAVTNNGGTINAGSTLLNPGNASVTTSCLFVINSGTNNLGSVIIKRSNAGSGAYSTLGTEGLMIYGGQVTMAGLDAGNSSGNSYLTALIAGGIVTNNGSVLVSQGSSGRGSRVLQTGGLFVVTNLVNPNPTASGSLNVYSVTGGTNIVGGIAFGAGGSGNVYFTNSAVIYVGSRGIVWDGSVTLSAVLNGGSLLGATANWTGSAPLQLGAGTATIQAADLNGTAQNITISGVLSGSGGLAKTGAGTLTLGAGDNYAGNTAILGGSLAITTGGSVITPKITVGSGTTFDVSQTGGFTLNSGQTLAGFGVVTGAVNVASGATLYPGSGALTGTLSFSNSVTETGGAVNEFTLAGAPNPSNDLAVINGNFNVSGSNNVFISGSSLVAGDIYRLFKYAGSFNGSLANLTVQNAVGTLTNDTPNSIAFVPLVTLRGPANTVWVGNPVNTNWDVEVSTNWLNGVTLDYFVPGDNVQFTDAHASNAPVNIAGTVTPGSILVNSHSNYVFASTSGGSIGGTAGLTVTNTGTLTILTTNTYSGLTTIEGGGTLVVSNLANSLAPSPIGESGSLVISNGTFVYGGPGVSVDLALTLLTTNSTVDVSANGNLTLGSSLSGPGGLTVAGNGILIVNGALGYVGSTTLSNGTLEVNGAASLGANAVNFDGGTLSLESQSAQNFYANTFNVLTAGTLYFNGANANNIIGTSGGAGSITGTGVLNIDIPNAAVYCTFNEKLDGFAGTFHLTDDSTGFIRLNSGGNATGAQICNGSTNATFDLGNGSAVIINRNGGGASFGNYNLGGLAGGVSTFLKGCAAGSSASTYSIGANNLSTIFSGIIEDGPASGAVVAITKTGTGTLTLLGQNSYSGPTIVSNGVLALAYNSTNSADASINTGGNVTIEPGAVLDVSGEVQNPGTWEFSSGLLQGSGTIRGSLNVSGGTVAPGGGPGGNPGTLTVTNSINLGGTVWMKLNGANSTNSDRLVSSLSTITYGGTLVLTNIGAGLHVGETFTLFSGGGLSGGSFSTIVQPDYYTLDTTQLGVNGTVTVSAALPPPTFAGTDFSDLSNSSITLNAINGFPGGPVIVFTSTNLAPPLTGWTPIATNNFDGNGNLSLQITVNPNAPQSYYLMQAY